MVRTLSGIPVAQTTTPLKGRGHVSTPLCVSGWFKSSESMAHESCCIRGWETVELEEEAPGRAGRNLTLGTYFLAVSR